MSMDKSLRVFAEAKLAELKRADRLRTLVPTSRGQQGRAERENEQLISFCDNDYLGLATDPRLVAAAQAAAQTWGVGAGASRLVTGDTPLNRRIEDQLAKMKGQEDARLFGSGYLANVGVIPVLVGRGDRIIMDAAAHACMHAGARLSGAAIDLFRHNDLDDLRRLMSQEIGARRTLVLTETVFSMDGDRAPLSQIGALCETFGAWLMTDDAHGFGVVHQDNPAHVQMGTFSKAVGSYGGYVCGPTALMELLTNRARSLIYTTGLPPTVLGATLEALNIIQSEPKRGERVMDRARLFCRLTDLPEPESAIVPILLGPEKEALRASEQLRQSGYLVTAIRPPTVPVNTARLRVTFSATHEEADIRALAAAILDLKVLA